MTGFVRKSGSVIACFILAGLILMIPGQVRGAGFAIIEQSVSGLGNAFAGGAASAEDATTIFFNPAGMTRIDHAEAILGIHWIIPSAEFNNEGSTHVLQPVTGVPLAGGNGGDGGVNVLVPNIYYVRPLGKGLTFGLGINAPFGLATEYDSNWVGRYHAIKSDLVSINVNPSLAYKVNNHLSLGAGFSIQYLEAELTNAIDFGTLDAIGAFTPLGIPAGALGLIPQGSDGFVKLEGDSIGFGFNLGLLYEFTENTRLGIAYRSRVYQDVEGDADFSGVPAGLAAAPLFKDTGAEAQITLPDTASISLYHRFNPQWAVMADITWTDWDVMKELRFKFDNPFQSDGVTTLNWKDAFRYSLGVTFNPNERLAVRGGIAYDETPIPDPEHRTPRIPGEDRLWLSFGLGYRISDSFSVDLGYAHLFVDDPRIDKSPTGEDAVRGGLKGTFDASVDIISGQIVWRF